MNARTTSIPRIVVAVAVLATSAAVLRADAPAASAPLDAPAAMTAPAAELAGRSHILLTKRMRIVLAYRSVVPA